MKVLYVNACVRDNSRTKQLADYYLETHCFDDIIEEINLSEISLKPFSKDMLDQRDHCIMEGNYKDSIFDLAHSFASADLIILAAPYWDLSFPASVKSYIEHITVAGLTFQYSEEGFPQGLCRAQELVYITTSGGYIGRYDFGFQYISTMASGMYGISKVTRYSAEGLDIVGNDVEEILNNTKKEME